MYADHREAVVDQFPEVAHEEALRKTESARGWACFGSMRRRTRTHWRGMDRSIVHLNKLGGPSPVLSTVVHETAHHHLSQKAGVPYKLHSTEEVEEEVNKLTIRWLHELPEYVFRKDSGAAIRTLDILLQQQEASS
jgi:hypothetical protein